MLCEILTSTSKRQVAETRTPQALLAAQGQRPIAFHRKWCAYMVAAKKHLPAVDIHGANALKLSRLGGIGRQHWRGCMPDENALEVRCYKAYHPRWTGHLLLQSSGNKIVHKETGSTGTYEESSHRINVAWDKYPREAFYLGAGLCVHESMMQNLPDIASVKIASSLGVPICISKISVSVPFEEYQVELRTGTSDVPVFSQIFTRKEYDSPYLPDRADNIVDLGANIGLGAVYFGLKYPNAMILCVEPESSNFDMLCVNTAALGERVKRSLAAVWTHDGVINLHMETNDGRNLGQWGVQVSDQITPEAKSTQCFRLVTLMKNVAFDSVDILKVDIEGSELELFSCGQNEWLDRVKFVIVETHDRFKEGTEAAVRLALSTHFRELPRNGENLFFARN